jgi:hypothetical protein
MPMCSYQKIIKKCYRLLNKTQGSIILVPKNRGIVQRISLFFKTMQAITSITTMSKKEFNVREFTYLDTKMEITSKNNKKKKTSIVLRLIK